ncbi:hypothetical protein VNO78_12159 [Psophocarpus tetragonolobus]|uniref:PXA domain-containing protein n=1 Tax=Psophocarpus tetragonolobus TaxID=3891 RepID=A0AAN9SQF4_PSOTE
MGSSSSHTPSSSSHSSDGWNVEVHLSGETPCSSHSRLRCCDNFFDNLTLIISFSHFHSFGTKWKRKIDSPVVEAAMGDFIDKILKDSVVDSWMDLVLQRLMSAVLATVLRQPEARCAVIRSIARELLTCLVMQPVMNLASPGFRKWEVNVDDAMDDIVRQFKGVSDGLRRKVVGSSSLISEGSTSSTTTWNADEIDKSIPRLGNSESVLSSDNEEGEKKNNLDNENIVKEVEDSGQHSDNTLFSKGYSSLINNHNEESNNMDFDRKHDIVVEARVGNDVPLTNFILTRNNLEDPVGVPPEVSVAS